jgi:hypothetical protein
VEYWDISTPGVIFLFLDFFQHESSREHDERQDDQIMVHHQ